MKNDVMTLSARQLQRWPEARVQDVVKALYQAEFGCGHLITDADRGLQWLRAEMAQCPSDADAPLTEGLGEFSRVHLAPAAQLGLGMETLFRLFALSAQEKVGSMERFCRQLDALEEMAASGEIPLDAEETQRFLAQYRASGCPATRHSQTFRDAYQPAYRVVRSDYARWLTVFAAIDQRLAQGGAVTVALEGGSASGKSTLAALLGQVYGCTVLHMDDFFLQPHQRTPERLAEPGGNVDRERFLLEVLTPLRARQPFAYRPFSCRTMAMDVPVQVTPGQLAVVEGAYSMHPDLADAYDLSVFLDVDADCQWERISRRNGEAMRRRFLEEWIPMEEKYFAHFGVKERCTLRVQVK